MSMATDAASEIEQVAIPSGNSMRWQSSPRYHRPAPGMGIACDSEIRDCQLLPRAAAEARRLKPCRRCFPMEDGGR